MAVTDAYATAADYRAVVGKNDTGHDDEIDKDLKAVSRYIDRRLGRFFTKDASPVARVFEVLGSSGTPRNDWMETENPFLHGGFQRLLSVDDLAATPESVIIDEDGDGAFDDTALATSDYLLLPRNADKGPEPAPFTAIEIPSWSTRGGWPGGRQVQITAVWGWPSVPEAVQRGTVHLAGILRLETPRATRTMNEVGQVVSTSKKAQDLVDELIRHYRSGRSIV